MSKIKNEVIIEDSSNMVDASSRLTPKAFENYIVNKAYKEVERRIDSGTATSQEITYFLQRGSPVQKLKEVKLQKEIELLDAKKKAIEKSSEMDVLYNNAIKAFSDYSPSNDNLLPEDVISEEDDNY